MVYYPNTGSILTAESGRNQTRTAVSTNIIIEVDGQAVGGIQNISVNETRSIKMIDEVGTDGHIDSVPQKSTDIEGSCQRVRFDNLRIAAAFSRGFIHAASQRIAFDIQIKDVFAAAQALDGPPDAARTLTTTLKNVWIKSLKVNYRADDFVITDDMDFAAEHIYSTLGSSDRSVALNPNGGRSINVIDNDPFEGQADTGKRRGALDASGLLLAVDTIV